MTTVDTGGPGPPGWRPTGAFTLRDRATWVLLGTYLAAAAVLMSPVLAHPSSRLAGAFSDPIGFTWWLAVACHWVTHGGDLFHPSFVNAPVGISTLWNTSVLGLGLPASPVTAVAGPVVAYNLLVLLGLALDGWVMAIAAGRWMSRPAGVVAGALLGFGAYAVAQAQAHLHLTFFVYPVLLLLLGTDLLRGAPPRRVALYVALATVWQFFVSTEVLATSVVFLAVLGVVAVVLHPGVRRRVRPLVTAFAVGLAGATASLAYPLAYLWATPTRTSFASQPAKLYSANLANLIVPTPLDLFDPKAGIFGGNLAEGGLYLGAPLLLALVLGAIATWERPLTRVLVVAGGCMTVLSLGPEVRYHNAIVRLPMPWTLLSHLPLLGDALPARLDGYVYLCAAALAGIAVYAGLLRRATIDRILLGLLALACFVTLLPRPFAAVPAVVPRYFTSPAVDAIPAGSVVQTVPAVTTTTMNPLLWQATAGYRYRTTGTFWEGGPVAAGTVFSAWISGGKPAAHLEVLACRTLRRTRTAAVLVAPSAPRPVVREVAHLTGADPRREGGMIVFSLPGSRC